MVTILTKTSWLSHLAKDNTKIEKGMTFIEQSLP
jgi:hypothetical protein